MTLSTGKKLTHKLLPRGHTFHWEGRKYMVTAQGKKPFTGVVKCPICGEVMILTEFNSGTSDFDPYNFHYECKECNTEVQVYSVKK